MTVRDDEFLVADPLLNCLDLTPPTVLDMDSTDVPVYGERSNALTMSTVSPPCYHPLVLFKREGNYLAFKEVFPRGGLDRFHSWCRLVLK